MSNRLTGNLAGISLGGIYQGNLKGIGINDVSEIIDKQEIHRANGVYQARQSSNVDHLTGITTIPKNEPSYRNNNQPSIGERGSDLEKFFSYQKKLDEFYQNGGFASCKRVEDLPWNKQKENELIFEKFLHGVLERKRERENNHYDLHSRFSLLGGGSIVPLSSESEEVEDNNAVPIRKLFYVGDSGLSEELRNSLQSSLEMIRNMTASELTGAAEKIIGILNILKPHPGIAALHIAIGLCVVAQEVQKKRDDTKRILEQQGCRPEDISAFLEKEVPKWFYDEAMKFFVLGWLGKIKNILTEDKLLRVLLSEGTGAYVTLLKKLGAYDEISRANTLALEWKRVMESDYREDGVD